MFMDRNQVCIPYDSMQLEYKEDMTMNWAGR